jgi:hypothetical protein
MAKFALMILSSQWDLFFLFIVLLSHEPTSKLLKRSPMVILSAVQNTKLSFFFA